MIYTDMSSMNVEYIFCKRIAHIDLGKSLGMGKMPKSQDFMEITLLLIYSTNLFLCLWIKALHVHL